MKFLKDRDFFFFFFNEIINIKSQIPRALRVKFSYVLSSHAPRTVLSFELGRPDMRSISAFKCQRS